MAAGSHLGLWPPEGSGGWCPYEKLSMRYQSALVPSIMLLTQSAVFGQFLWLSCSTMSDLILFSVMHILFVEDRQPEPDQLTCPLAVECDMKSSCKSVSLITGTTAQCNKIELHRNILQDLVDFASTIVLKYIVTNG